jgi:hypothetical protein
LTSARIFHTIRSMKILEIRNIIKKDLPLHYRNEFSGSLVYETLTKKKEEKRVEFTLEKNAFGKVDVKVNILEEIDYPLIPVINSLKTYILDMQKKGQLF